MSGDWRKVNPVDAPEPEDRGQELAEAHWSYIEELLEAHNELENITALVKFHYISAFIHGYKHAMENHNEENKKS